jgi:hypothetical protein
MEDRQQLLEKLERYRTILRMTTDPQAIAALELVPSAVPVNMRQVLVLRDLTASLGL